MTSKPVGTEASQSLFMVVKVVQNIGSFNKKQLCLE